MNNHNGNCVPLINYQLSTNFSARKNNELLLMKKLILTIVLIFLLFIAFAYLFFPARPSVSYTISLHCNANSMGRYLDTKMKWESWWTFADSSFSYRAGRQFPLLKELYINDKGVELLSTLLIHPVAGKSDSVDMVWQLVLNRSSYNPVQRIINYREATAIKKNAVQVLDSMKRFFQKESTYGISIHEATITDSILLVKKHIYSSYPSTDSVYTLFDELKSVISANKAMQTGNPLLNVTQLGDGQFQTTAALPINRMFNTDKNFQTKKMLNGVFLISEVDGGVSMIEKSLLELQYYFLDHNRTMMAMPFQILITDRRSEKDSSKWITQIYVPTF